MIENACNSDINELKKLWQLCFGDEDEYVNFFFSKRFIPENTFVYRIGGRIVSQLFLLEGAFKVNNAVYPSYYLYAACTHPEFRCKGIMKELLLFVESEAKNRGIDFICLVPAENSLFGYYARFSYKPVFSKKVFNVKSSDFSSEYNYILKDNVNYNTALFRNSYLTNKDCFLWDDKSLKYAFKENEFSDGILFVNDYGYALLRDVDDNTCRIIEICTINNCYERMIDDIFKKYHFEKMIIDSPVDRHIYNCDGEIINNAMALAVTDTAKELIDKIDGAYFGLALE